MEQRQSDGGTWSPPPMYGTWFSPPTYGRRYYLEIVGRRRLLIRSHGELDGYRVARCEVVQVRTVQSTTRVRALKRQTASQKSPFVLLGKGLRWGLCRTTTARSRTTQGDVNPVDVGPGLGRLSCGEP